MKITDQQLSAFLDAELPEPDMERVREALAEDDSVTDRLAELARVDALVAAAYTRIDQQPMPASVEALLENPPAQVVAFPRQNNFPRAGVRSWLQPPVAMAASLVLAIGVGIALSLQPGADRDWQSVAQVLDSSRSGIAQALPGGGEVKPQLTFIDHRGDVCRQFQQRFGDGRREAAIACRRDGSWQAVERAPLTGADSELYQTASANDVLASALDRMLAEGPFDAATETRLIQQQRTTSPEK